MTKANPNTIDAYIATFPVEVQVLLKKLRKTIQSAIPGTHDVTAGISYKIPTFYLNGKYLVYFAAFKNHLSVYPATTAAVDQAGLADYKVAKGTLKFPLNQPIPFDLIKKFVQYRVEEHLAGVDDEATKIKICSRGHEYQGSGPCPVCWPGRKRKK